MSVDLFEIYKDGDIKQVPMAGEDKIVIMDDNNQRTNETVNIGEDAKLKPVSATDGKTYNILEISDPAKAKEAFKTIAANTDKEYGLINYNQSNGNSNSAIVSQGETDKVNAGGVADALYDKNGKSVSEIIHNHPNNTTPSGYNRMTGEIELPLRGDAKGATSYSRNSRGEFIKWGVYNSAFNSIYRYDAEKVYHGEAY